MEENYIYRPRTAMVNGQLLLTISSALINRAMSLMKIILFLVTLRLENVAFATTADPYISKLSSALVVNVRDFQPYTIVNQNGIVKTGVEIMFIEAIATKLGLSVQYESNGAPAERLPIF